MGLWRSGSKALPSMLHIAISPRPNASLSSPIPRATRTLSTGASIANLAVILIDARNGVVTQSRRHAYIASLVGIPHLVVAVNKMDLVGYSRDVFGDIREEFDGFAAGLHFRDIIHIP